MSPLAEAILAGFVGVSLLVLSFGAVFPWKSHNNEEDE